MSGTIKNPMLSAAASAHLENLLDIEAGRRPIDAALRSPIIDARDVLLCAATNLESGVPQSQPGVAAKLRAVADLLVEMDLSLTTLYTQRSVFRIGRAPQLRRMARTLLVIADDFGDPPAAPAPGETRHE